MQETGINSCYMSVLIKESQEKCIGKELIVIAEQIVMSANRMKEIQASSKI